MKIEEPQYFHVMKLHDHCADLRFGHDQIGQAVPIMPSPCVVKIFYAASDLK